MLAPLNTSVKSPKLVAQGGGTAPSDLQWKFNSSKSKAIGINGARALFNGPGGCCINTLARNNITAVAVIAHTQPRS